MSSDSIDDLFGQLYADLRRLAASALRSKASSHTLQPTALVHEVWLKIARAGIEPKDRGHFLSTAARAMRQVLRDHARAQRTLKRGERAPTVELEVVGRAQANAAPGEASVGFDLLALDDALEKLASLNARQARIAELRILGGLTLPEAATELDISERTAQSDWVFARTWLRVKLAAEEP